ncbi:uromodulin-like [Aquarana catesbeiana]|uniref:uromodulin-like n=1 Tax=Aquarana catesbeiana TaxID=8400 RepID=UPI003CC94DA6
MSKLLVILMILASTSVVTYTADQSKGQYGLSRVDGRVDGRADGRCSSQLVNLANVCFFFSPESSSLAYAVDTTGSMYDDFMELKKVNGWLLDRVEAKFPCGVRQYTMVEFNDPRVGPVRYTNSKERFDEFFTNLVATGGGDCPELAIAGIKQALLSSPRQSFILVLTDASAKDYSNIALVNEVFSLIRSTQSQVVFLITGMCGSYFDPDYTIYRDIATASYGHVFNVPLSDLNKVFHYLDFTLSIPVNSSELLFSGDFTALVHTERFLVDGNFSSLMITTDGAINTLQLAGPARTLHLEVLVSEIWGSVRLLKNPEKGNYSIDINAGGVHAIRVQGFTATNISSAASCSECHLHALCEEYADYVQCVCRDGFVGDGFNCSDIDECAYVWTHNCSAGTCQNTFGSYTCLCPSGFIFSEGSCVPIRECDDPSLNRCHPLAQCINKLSGYSCVCPNGYYGDGFHCEIDECQRGACGFGLECTKALGSYACSDPCVSRTVLNEPWRSTNNTLSSTPNCDSSKNGWYQFVGSAGIRMPETCVPINRCNTAAPMWMSGTHPVMKDGIVNRTTCANWNGNCSLWTSTIQVKACPLGYHVYKLIGTPESKCTLSYCTEPLAVQEVCAADEEWKSGDKGDRCYCKDQFKVSSMSDVRPKLTCGLDEMRASFQKCQMKELDTYFGRENVKDGGCFSFEDNSVTNTFSVLAALQVRGCGVQSYQNGSHVTYRSTFVIELHNGIIMRNDTLTVTLSCVYELDMITSLNLALRPIISSINITVGGTGQFKASMVLYKDSSYTTPYEGSEVSLSSKTMLYIGAFIQGGDTSQYVLVMRNCYATPTQAANDTVNYYIIKDSCPNKQDDTINVLENGVSRQGRVSVQMFKFVGDYDLVYLHCAVSLCEVKSGSCQPSCTSRRSQRTELDSHNLRIGPIIRSGTLVHG